MIELLLPLATVITPNLPEARVLAGTGADARARATPRISRARCTRSGPDAVVVTGGHREEATDVFFDGAEIDAHPRPTPPRRRRPRLRLHALLRARRAPRARILAAARRAERARVVAAEAVRDGLREIGRGRRPRGRVRLTARAASPHTPSWRADRRGTSAPRDIIAG